MSCSAHAKVLLGVEVAVEATKVSRPVTRFDSKTGKPIEILDDAIDLVLVIGEERMILPPDSKLWCDVEKETGGCRPRSWDFWHRDRTETRVHQFFRDHKIYADECERHAGDPDLIYDDPRGTFVVGKLLADGSDGGYGDRDALVEFHPVKVNGVACRRAAEAIQETLGLKVRPAVSAYLITNLSC